jgi:hypothetical protein
MPIIRGDRFFVTYDGGSHVYVDIISVNNVAVPKKYLLPLRFMDTRLATKIRNGVMLIRNGLHPDDFAMELVE